MKERQKQQIFGKQVAQWQMQEVSIGFWLGYQVAWFIGESWKAETIRWMAGW